MNISFHNCPLPVPLTLKDESSLNHQYYHVKCQESPPKRLLHEPKLHVVLPYANTQLILDAEDLHEKSCPQQKKLMALGGIEPSFIKDDENSF